MIWHYNIIVYRYIIFLGSKYKCFINIYSYRSFYYFFRAGMETRPYIIFNVRQYMFFILCTYRHKITTVLAVILIR